MHKGHSPAAILSAINDINDAYRELPYDNNFSDVIHTIIDRIGFLQLYENKKGRITHSSSVYETIIKAKEEPLYDEMIDAVIALGDDFYHRPGPYRHVDDSYSKKRTVIYDLLNYSTFDTCYYYAKEQKKHQKR